MAVVRSPRVRSSTAAEGVGAAAEAAGDTVGIVDGDEQAVDVVHRAHQLLGAGEVAGAEAVEQLAAELARGFGEAVAIRRDFELQVLRRRQRVVADERERERRFREFLLGVRERAVRADVGMVDERGVRLGEERGASAASWAALSNSPRCVARIDAAHAWIARGTRRW